MVVGLSFPTPYPGVQPHMATGELPLLLPDVQNLQEKEQCQVAGQGAPD